eukprot:CAMPEP_0115719012 /NCGR_PEP_ID=MMETSP0272-20121206/77746_1 /TAXON_ID=71861 /ORGANISM="Scrippsiella trochoidea, Strain CCMP3099" /LENGTH=54 /DNA_ID=CAMNT_0003161597 /DNA_START=69 /DNA_END=233 /DNA_ORIENTATION=-
MIRPSGDSSTEMSKKALCVIVVSGFTSSHLSRYGHLSHLAFFNNVMTIQRSPWS